MIKITFLIDKNNNWIQKFLKINNFGKKYNINSLTTIQKK